LKQKKIEFNYIKAMRKKYFMFLKSMVIDIIKYFAKIKTNKKGIEYTKAMKISKAMKIM